ncbi:MAG: toll/interleukin-1 receptor domain-containing protein [Desulfobacterales bacterium]|nr:toll/interleukin-1 receptor domain-containing protein [Desulfobacterales bacterium]
MDRPTIFISYSHKDEVWKDRLKTHLKVLELADCISVWDDRKITPSGEWYPEIKDAMEKATVAVCLISADYLASTFCVKEEIPYLLDRRKKQGLAILPVLIRPCLWTIISWIEKTQMLPRDGKTISEDYENNWDAAFTEVAEIIFNIVSVPGFKPPPPRTPAWSPPEKVDLERLPMTGVELFGRQNELEMLD